MVETQTLVPRPASESELSSGLLCEWPPDPDFEPSPPVLELHNFPPSGPRTIPSVGTFSVIILEATATAADDDDDGSGSGSGAAADDGDMAQPTQPQRNTCGSSRPLQRTRDAGDGSFAPLHVGVKDSPLTHVAPHLWRAGFARIRHARHAACNLVKHASVCVGSNRVHHPCSYHPTLY